MLIQRRGWVLEPGHLLLGGWYRVILINEFSHPLYVIGWKCWAGFSMRPDRWSVQSHVATVGLIDYWTDSSTKEHRHQFKSWLCPSPAVWPGARPLAPLGIICPAGESVSLGRYQKHRRSGTRYAVWGLPCSLTYINRMPMNWLSTPFSGQTLK